MIQQRWPGNVRELRNAIERACLLSQDRWIDAKLLVDHDGAIRPSEFDAAPAPPLLRLEDYLREQERAYIQRTLAHHDWQITNTAEALGISRKGLWERMKRLGIG